jgi:hypothetical protein
MKRGRNENGSKCHHCSRSRLIQGVQFQSDHSTLTTKLDDRRGILLEEVALEIGHRELEMVADGYV